MQKRAGHKFSLLSAIAGGSALSRADDWRRAGRRRPHRQRLVVAMGRTAGLIAVLVAVTTAPSVARPAADVSVRVHARLSHGADSPLLQIEGVPDAGKRGRFVITGSLRGVPCSGTYRVVIAGNLGSKSSWYDGTVVLRKSGGDRIPCGVPLQGDLGRTFVRIQVYRPGATPADAFIVIEGRRFNATAFEGSFIFSDMFCHGPSTLRFQLSSSSRRLSILYDMRMKKVSFRGGGCL
jgi:hypothetical protein